MHTDTHLQELEHVEQALEHARDVARGHGTPAAAAAAAAAGAPGATLGPLHGHERQRPARGRVVQDHPPRAERLEHALHERAAQLPKLLRAHVSLAQRGQQLPEARRVVVVHAPEGPGKRREHGHAAPAHDDRARPQLAERRPKPRALAPQRRSDRHERGHVVRALAAAAPCHAVRSLLRDAAGCSAVKGRRHAPHTHTHTSARTRLYNVPQAPEVPRALRVPPHRDVAVELEENLVRLHNEHSCSMPSLRDTQQRPGLACTNARSTSTTPSACAMSSVSCASAPDAAPAFARSAPPEPSTSASTSCAAAASVHARHAFGAPLAHTAEARRARAALPGAAHSPAPTHARRAAPRRAPRHLQRRRHVLHARSEVRRARRAVRELREVRLHRASDRRVHLADAPLHIRQRPRRASGVQRRSGGHDRSWDTHFVIAPFRRKRFEFARAAVAAAAAEQHRCVQWYASTRLWCTGTHSTHGWYTCTAQACTCQPARPRRWRRRRGLRRR